MQKAAFSIERYFFKKVLIDLGNHHNQDLSLSFETHGNYNQSDGIYELNFKLIAFNEGFSENPFVEIQCIGIFKFENSINFEDIPDYFYRNCIAILFPYVRAYLSIVTTQANVPGIMLPTMNLSSLEKTLRQNTTNS
jgi:preprotein translocase subunit SecB